MKIERLGEEHLPRLHALFEACSSTCYCRYWHFTGTKNDWLDRCANRPEESKRELDDAVRANDPSACGLVALADDGRVIGWMKLTRALPKLRALPVYRNLALGDPATTFGVGCFLVHPAERERGVALALLRAAPNLAKVWGATRIEGYPRRSDAPLYPEEAWQGPERAFRAAGFAIEHDETPYPVYVLKIE